MASVGFELTDLAVSRKEDVSPSGASAPLRLVRKPNFLQKLHSVLNMAGFSNIITWLPSGRSFCIVDRDAFTKIILPRFFRHTKFQSFGRRYVSLAFLR